MPANQISVIDWHIHPFRADRFLEGWMDAAERALAFGASSWSLTRSVDNPLHFRQTASWESKEDFERYWASDEIAAAREELMNLFNKPLLAEWYTLIASDSGATAGGEGPVDEEAA